MYDRELCMEVLHQIETLLGKQTLYLPSLTPPVTQDLLGKKVEVVTPAALHPKIRDRILQQAIDI
jgi:predicted nucleotidyltransferase